MSLTNTDELDIFTIPLSQNTMPTSIIRRPLPSELNHRMSPSEFVKRMRWGTLLALIDLETGGLSPKYHDPITLSLIMYDLYMGSTNFSMSIPFKPGRPSTKEAIQVHGIEPALQNTRPFASLYDSGSLVYNAFIEVLKGARCQSLLSPNCDSPYQKRDPEEYSHFSSYAPNNLTYFPPMIIDAVSKEQQQPAQYRNNTASAIQIAAYCKNGFDHKFLQLAFPELPSGFYGTISVNVGNLTGYRTLELHSGTINSLGNWRENVGIGSQGAHNATADTLSFATMLDDWFITLYEKTGCAYQAVIQMGEALKFTPMAIDGRHF